MKPDPTSDSTVQTILIIDDTPANVGVLGDYLEDRGYRVVVAQDGAEGLRRAQFTRPDLILLDVMMPGMDGFETCQRLKEIESTCDIPVIFMTALTDLSEKMAGFDAGGVDYVIKPFQIAEVMARIGTHLALRTMQRQMVAQNLQLQQEINIRLQAEAELCASYAELQETHNKLAQLHQQLLQSEKMASLGQLAAGVAHEINNPIAFVNSNLGTLKDYVEALWELVATYERTEHALVGHPALLDELRGARARLDIDYVRGDLHNVLAESLEGVMRVRRIVQDLKDFSHVGEIERQVVDLHEGIDSTLNIVWHELKQKAEVRKEYCAIPSIEGVPAQLNQVFMNLLVNAGQAIDKRGIITIRTGGGEGWVWVEIADTGNGIKPEHMPHVFEPFFTTKPIGQGTGLGLSLSYGIINQHGGRIDVQSDPGKGTAFRVWLPIGSAA